MSKLRKKGKHKPCGFFEDELTAYVKANKGKKDRWCVLVLAGGFQVAGHIGDESADTIVLYNKEGVPMSVNDRMVIAFTPIKPPE